MEKQLDFLDKSTWALAILLLALILLSNVAIGGSDSNLESKALDLDSNTTVVPTPEAAAEEIPLNDANE